jgi:DNA-directed RNA polymerase specialized sigma24 family protein
MEGLKNLFTLLDSDTQGEPGESYELVRLKLIRYFEWRRCLDSEEMADETIDRVARKIEQGEQINNLMGYFYGVARLVNKEYERAQEKRRRAFATLPMSSEDIANGNESAELRLACSKKCLKDLSEVDRELITAYCKPDGRSKMERRQDLATHLDIKREALRLKAFRIRKKLHECMDNCLKDH